MKSEILIIIVTVSGLINLSHVYGEVDSKNAFTSFSACLELSDRWLVGFASLHEL